MSSWTIFFLICLRQKTILNQKQSHNHPYVPCAHCNAWHKPESWSLCSIQAIVNLKHVKSRNSAHSKVLLVGSCGQIALSLSLSLTLKTRTLHIHCYLGRSEENKTPPRVGESTNPLSVTAHLRWKQEGLCRISYGGVVCITNQMFLKRENKNKGCEYQPLGMPWVTYGYPLSHFNHTTMRTLTIAHDC